MLEKHVEKQDPVWDTNSVWLAFLFLCICWLSVMLLIIFREEINQQTVFDLMEERAYAEARMMTLDPSELGSTEMVTLEERLRSIEARLGQAQRPPTFLFMIFSGLEGIFILGFYILLFRLRHQIHPLGMKVYLAVMPLGFIYFFLLVTLGRYHTWTQLVGDRSTKFLTVMVVLYFSVGLVWVTGRSMWLSLGRRERPKAKPL